MVGAEATLVAVLCAIGRPDLSTKITPAAIAGLQSKPAGPAVDLGLQDRLDRLAAKFASIPLEDLNAENDE
jgi:hypothetical protein